MNSICVLVESTHETDALADCGRHRTPSNRIMVIDSIRDRYRRDEVERLRPVSALGDDGRLQSARTGNSADQTGCVRAAGCKAGFIPWGPNFPHFYALHGRRMLRARRSWRHRRPVDRSGHEPTEGMNMNVVPQYRNCVLQITLLTASVLALATVLGLAVIEIQSAQAQTFTTLYSFCAKTSCTDGGNP
jgi:hypothetical protein